MLTNLTARSVVATLLLIASVAAVAIVPAHALPITAPEGQASCDTLSMADKGRFIKGMVDDTIQLLQAESKLEMAKRVSDLFTVLVPGTRSSLGVTQLYEEMAFFREMEAKDAAGGKQIHVQHAMISVLKKNNIDIPRNVTTMARTFKPSDPPREAYPTDGPAMI